jgi:hypothetical protein
MTMTRTSILSAVALAAFLAAMPLEASAQQAFDTPDAAAKALVDAARTPEQGMLDRIFGPGGKELLASGDPATDKQRLADFLALAEKGSAVVDGPAGHKELAFGGQGWRFPIPLQKQGSGWTFDLAAGKQAMLDRRIGLNELSAIGACADYVAAQTEYRLSLHDDEPVPQYARRLLSTPGYHDGLYWTPASAADRSPLGDRIAGAIDEGGNGRPRSYRGYTFRILTAQGPDAPGGAFDYIVKGRLLAGFAMIAAPLAWGETGIMTFLCDQQGRVWERNLGEKTSALAREITRFDPGPGWTPVNFQN